MARKPKSNVSENPQKPQRRVFHSIEEIRRTYYPKAHEEMNRRKTESGLGEFSLSEKPDSGAAVGE